MTEVAEVVRQLATGRTDWQQVTGFVIICHWALFLPVAWISLKQYLQVTQKFPKFEAQETKS